MDDNDDSCFDLDQFPYLPGVDLTLWLQIVVGVIVLALGAGLVVGLAG
jgi:hypothetical protein